MSKLTVFGKMISVITYNLFIFQACGVWFEWHKLIYKWKINGFLIDKTMQ